jgi:hypothetical protein
MADYIEENLGRVCLQTDVPSDHIELTAIESVTSLLFLPKQKQTNSMV